MTIDQLLSHLRRFPRHAPLLTCELSILIDEEAGLVQSLTLHDQEYEDDGNLGDESEPATEPAVLRLVG